MKHLFSWLLRHCLLPVFTALHTQSHLSLNAKSHTGIRKCFFHVSVGIRQMYRTAIKEAMCFRGRENGTKCLMLVFCIQLWKVIPILRQKYICICTLQCYAYPRKSQNWWGNLMDTNTLKSLKIQIIPMRKQVLLHRSCYWRFKAAELGQDHLFYMLIKFLQSGTL